MSDLTIHVDDQLLFRLKAGRRPLVYPDSITYVSYESGVNVLYVGAVWAIGVFADIEAFELDDGTVVAVADVDLDSLIVNPSNPSRYAVET